jgi:predicted nucleic acid-binding protein
MSSERSDLVLDADVLMNILATDRLDEILAGNGVRGLLCPKTMAEAVYLNPRVSGDPRDAIDLAPHIASGILVSSSLSQEEVASYLRFAAEVDDGEAQVLAVGLHRRLTIATDDRRARRVATREGLELVGTPELIMEWARGRAPGLAELRSAVVDIEVRARYRPRPSDPNRPEWDRLRNG